MNEPKTITRSQYLQAFALYTMASKLQADAVRFEIEMNRVLGLEGPEFKGSRVSDGIYNSPPEPFELVLEYVKISVEPDSGPSFSNGKL